MNEEEAIERCNELIKESHSCWIGITNQEAIYTVLNLIDKQQAELELQTLLEDESRKQLKIRDEIIDLMCTYISITDVEKRICPQILKETCYAEDLKLNMTGHEACNKCIKEYFENKVKESK